jgi:hypothetical protein
MSMPPAAAARAELESLLRARKLDRTLPVASPLPPPRPADRVVSSGVETFDLALGGGVPRGQISELVGPVSSGRTAVMHQLLAQATGQGELAAVIDVLDTFDPSGAAAHGVVLDRLLWVRVEGPAAARSAKDDVVTRAVKALNLVVSAGGFGLVVCDAGGLPPGRLRQLPFTTWLRVQRVIEGSDTACVLLADAPLARSPGGASVRLGSPGGRQMAVEDQSADFHARVRANRYLAAPASQGATARALWRGTGPGVRRFNGLAMKADVQYALRSASCELVATEHTEGR